MKVQCVECGGYFEDTDSKCPICGAKLVGVEYSGAGEHIVNNEQGTVQSIGDRVPKTIEELRVFCREKNLPLEQMRFFLGVDYKEPRAFGIYKDNITGNFVVYKNKADGTRAIRYSGPDEAYAVNEIYLKMKDEVRVQREYKASKSNGYIDSDSNGSGNKKGNLVKRVRKIVSKVSVMILFFSIIATSITNAAQPKTGYYEYNNTTYYCNRPFDWYIWDEGGEVWLPVGVEKKSELYKHHNKYFMESSYTTNRGYTDVTDSEYYTYYPQSSSSNSSSGSSDWDYGGGDWDSGASDWDSDW